MKIKLTLLLVVITTLGYSQSGAKWATGGNSSSTGDFFGTTNSFPIDFRTNNVSRMNLSTTGVFKINNLAGTGTRLLQTDANGNIMFLPQGTASQVLYGNGTWGALPVAPVIWQQAGSKAYYNNGFVGIGTNNPQVALDVVGDVKVSNNLYVGGGILISQKVEASSSMITDTVHSASGETKFTAKLMFLDKIQVEGATLLKSQFQVNGTSLFNGTVQANNLNVSGVTNFGNGANVNGTLNTSNLNVNGAFMSNTLNIGTATNNVDLKVQTNASGGTTLGFGYRSGPISAGPANSCVAPYLGIVTTAFNGRSVITAPNPVGTEPVFDFRNTATNGTIDYGFDYIQNPNPAQRTGPSTIPSIKINGSCWGDVELAKGGGFVSTGTHFEVGSPVSSYLIASNILSSSQIGQRVTLHSSVPDNYTGSDPFLVRYNIQLFVNKNKTRALSVFNTVTNTAGDELFTVFGDGKTQINSQVPTNNYFVINDISTSTPNEAFAITGNGYMKFNTPNPTIPVNVIDVQDITNNKNMFRVKSNGHVYAREVEIMNLSTPFPDYVFANDYKILSLSELENYINKNKHLPSFENAQYYETNGIKSSEMFIKQQEKIEELTLYIIELEKRMKAIEQLIKK